MNQQSANAGSFDPNIQNLAQHVIYDPSHAQQAHHVQHQQIYISQGYDIVDASDFVAQQQSQRLPAVSYATEYSNAQPISLSNIQSYYDPNLSVAQQQRMVFEQHSPLGSIPTVSNAGQQHYYVSDAASSQRSGYAYYVDQSGQQQRQNQYEQFGRQREYGTAGNFQIGVGNLGQVQQQMRPQPMTQEQLQLSQQRLLGIVVSQPEVQVQLHAQPQQQQHHQQPQLQIQLPPQHQFGLQPQTHIQQLQSHHPQPEQLQPQQQQPRLQQQPQLFQTLQLPLQSQSQFQHQIQQRSLPQQQIQQPVVGNYGVPIVNATTAATAADGSPAGSSSTSSGTDISDEGDEMVGTPSLYKRPSADASVKRQGKKRKLQKDPNEPQKPVSAYALFFRDTQAAIKGQNPSASFGDLSKIVASMWDNLDGDGKSLYKQKTELAKKDYLKQLAAYRANLLSKGTGSATGVPGSSGPCFEVQYSDQTSQQHHRSIQGQQWRPQQETTTASQIESGESALVCLISEPLPAQASTTAMAVAVIQQDAIPNRDLAKPQPLAVVKPDGMCIRAGCHNPAVECSQWDGEYCTDACVSRNCREGPAVAGTDSWLHDNSRKIEVIFSPPGYKAGNNNNTNCRKLWHRVNF